jgi:hypothetical protein
MYWSNLNINKNNLLLEAYSEKFIKERIEYLKKTGGASVDENTLRMMINRFDSLKMTKRADLEKFVKDSITNKEQFFTAATGIGGKADEERLQKMYKNPLQLEFYTFKNLEGVIDRFPPEEKKEIKKQLKERGEGPPIPIVYKNDGVIVFGARDVKDCQMFQRWARSQNLPKIKKLYDEGFPEPRTQETKNKLNLDKYSMGWYHYCIGYPSGPLYQSYRRGRAGGSWASMYYVYNNNKDITDPYHCFVVQAQNNGKLYLVTNAFNLGDHLRLWDNPGVTKDTPRGELGHGRPENERGILQIEPKLAGAKDIMVFHPFSEDEQIAAAIENAEAKDFDSLNSYKAKKVYIETPKPSTSKPRTIFKESFFKLPPELQHQYVNMRSPGPGQDPLEVLFNITKLFEDDDYFTYQKKSAKATEARKNGDPNWTDNLINDAIYQSKPSTVALYKKLITMILKEIGKKAKAKKLG